MHPEIEVIRFSGYFLYSIVCEIKYVKSKRADVYLRDRPGFQMQLPERNGDAGSIDIHWGKKIITAKK